MGQPLGNLRVGWRKEGKMLKQVQHDKEEGEPEDLPVSINHFTLSGEKQEMYRLYRLYTSTYFVPKAVTEKLNLQ